MSFKPNFLIDVTWLSRISYKLEKFKRASPSSHTYACRCVSCGDSESRKNKLSLYFYSKKNALNFECKRCGYSGSFWRFIREQCPSEFEDYKKEQMRERIEALRSSPTNKHSSPIATHQKEKIEASTMLKSSLDGVISMADLRDGHPAIDYLKNRGLTRDVFNRLLYSEDFRVTAESVVDAETLDENFPTEPRIVIPFYTESGQEVEMIQGRSIDPKSHMRYITLKSDPNVDKIYGKNTIDESRPVYCVEGPFDSLFIDNCLAACDANLARSDADVLIWDNEPRSINIVNYMNRAIENGRSLVVWPTSPDSKQDINDLILMGLDTETLMNVIKERTFNGIRAKLEVSKWRKV